jgi:adenosylcobinamide kinase / adenosylcobinamide-phosphate guanylyltransferase
MLTDNEKLILVTGGARSGKSRLAEEMAHAAGGPVVYMATAGVSDGEMAERVRVHRLRRPAGWTTLEEPLAVTEALKKVEAAGGTLILDCLTLWLTNLLLERYSEDLPPEAHQDLERGILQIVAGFVDTALAVPFRVIVVTNEVGLGVVPAYPLGRIYRDLAGRANQLVAAAADAVFLTVSGIPVRIKGGR